MMKKIVGKPTDKMTHGDANVLQLLCGERIPWVGPEAFHPCVCNAVQEDDE